MRSNVVCSSIEGEGMELQCRKFFPRPPRKLPTGTIIYPFTLSIYGIATVTKTLESQKSTWQTTSMVALDDSINGESIDGYAEKPLGKPVVRKGTGRHKASFIVSKAHCFAHVQIGTRDSLQDSKKKPALL